MNDKDDLSYKLKIKSDFHPIDAGLALHAPTPRIINLSHFMNGKNGAHFNETVANLVLLTLLLYSIFIVMLFPLQFQRTLYQTGMTAIPLSAFFCIDKKYQRIIRWLIILDIILIWAYFATASFVLNGISKSMIICLYFIIVIILVKQAASARTVNSIVILQSVNGYLMIGLFYSVIIALIMLFNPSAYSFSHNLINESGTIVTNFNEYIYYGFNAFTTVTYGDVLPISSLAKSISMAMGLTGQMYVALVIAMLIGKYAGSRKE